MGGITHFHVAARTLDTGLLILSYIQTTSLISLSRVIITQPSQWLYSQCGVHTVQLAHG